MWKIKYVNFVSAQLNSQHLFVFNTTYKFNQYVGLLYIAVANSDGLLWHSYAVDASAPSAAYMPLWFRSVLYR